MTFCPASSAGDKSDFEEALRLERLGHYGETARLLREVQRHRPDNAYVLAELANAYLNNYSDLKNGLDNAEKCSRRAIKLDPECGRAYARLAECRDAKGDYIEGVKFATKALTCKKPDWDAYRERAGAYSNLKRDKEALADYDQFLEKSPKVERKHLVQRATIMENLKQFDRALLEYRKLLKGKYEDQIVFREVVCLRALKKNDEALESLNKLVSHNKQDDSAYLVRARLFEAERL